METNNKVDVNKKLMMGAYSTKSFLINPFNGVITNQLNDSEQFAKSDSIKSAGESLPPLNKEFNKEEADSEYSYVSWQLDTCGQKNMGEVEQQLSEADENNFDSAQIFNQAKMRYNQLFAAEITIVIPGDFSLHAGDSVYMDIPLTDTSQSKACGDDVSKQDGGKYLITDLCHFITARDTYSKLVLIRDSFGRKGNPSKDKKGGTEDFNGVRVPKSTGGNSSNTSSPTLKSLFFFILIACSREISVSKFSGEFTIVNTLCRLISPVFLSIFALISFSVPNLVLAAFCIAVSIELNIISLSIDFSTATASAILKSSTLSDL